MAFVTFHTLWFLFILHPKIQPFSILGPRKGVKWNAIIILFYYSAKDSKSISNVSNENLYFFYHSQYV